MKQAHDGPADQPFLLLGQQSVADPTRAPEGKHTAWAYTHGPQDAPWTDAIVERIEAQVERFAPGFRDRILARHTLLPADLEARNANLAGGDVGGGSYRLRQVVFRPLPSSRPTPRRSRASTSAARRRSRAAPSTASRATRPRERHLKGSDPFRFDVAADRVPASTGTR